MAQLYGGKLMKAKPMHKITQEDLPDEIARAERAFKTNWESMLHYQKMAAKAWDRWRKLRYAQEGLTGGV